MNTAAAPAPTYSLEDQIKCLARELALRKNVYRNWISIGRMKPDAAEREIGSMEAALETLKRLRETADMSTPSTHAPGHVEETPKNKHVEGIV